MYREAARFFPGVPVARLKSRYAEKKAKTRHWTLADVYPLLTHLMEQDERLRSCIADYEEEKWKHVAGKMGLGIKVVKTRARVLGIK